MGRGVVWLVVFACAVGACSDGEETLDASVDRVDAFRPDAPPVGLLLIAWQPMLDGNAASCDEAGLSIYPLTMDLTDWATGAPYYSTNMLCELLSVAVPLPPGEYGVSVYEALGTPAEPVMFTIRDDVLTEVNVQLVRATIRVTWSILKAGQPSTCQEVDATNFRLSPLSVEGTCYDYMDWSGPYEPGQVFTATPSLYHFEPMGTISWVVAELPPVVLPVSPLGLDVHFEFLVD